MTPDTLRARGERFNEELSREAYRAGAGLSESTDFAAIVARYADLADDGALEAAAGVPPLVEWVADNRIGRRTAALDDRMSAWESRATIALPDGERMAYQQVSIAIGNEPRRERRLALDRARRDVLGEPTALRRERLDVEAELLAPFAGGGGVVAARTRLMGFDLDALGTACDTFLRDTADLYRDTLRERLGAHRLAPGDAHRSDGAWMFRGQAWDDAFPGEDLVDTARRQVGEMGLDVEAAGRIRFDTEDRPRKRPRAFCAPVRVPDEVYLVIRPHGGFTDYRAFWHELGHALHFGNADAGLPFEHRWLGDNSTTEAYAMLFEHQVAAPAWLTRYAGLSRERRAAFVREQAFNLLAIVRRYAAKLGYELALHRAGSLGAAPDLYVEALSSATGFRYDPEDALLDLDDGFYAARYLRAWQLESTLRQHLRDRFDDDWFRNPRCGPAVLELLAAGQRDNADAVAGAIGRPLAFAPLVAACEAALA